jgi:hypothetical protein
LNCNGSGKIQPEIEVKISSEAPEKFIATVVEGTGGQKKDLLPR